MMSCDRRSTKWDRLCRWGYKFVLICDHVHAQSRMSAASSSAGPSLKRSKWEDDDRDDVLARAGSVPVKRRLKYKTPKVEEHSPKSDRLPPRLARPTHSIHVPPRTYHPQIISSRSVYCYERLNQIEEGSYGVVFRARDRQTGDIVALKKLKLGEEKHGFPITALREINALMSCRHENVVGIREVVVGDTLTQCVLGYPSRTRR
jgi:cell division cycle 2-like